MLLALNVAASEVICSTPTADVFLPMPLCAFKSICKPPTLIALSASMLPLESMLVDPVVLAMDPAREISALICVDVKLISPEVRSPKKLIFTTLSALILCTCVMVWPTVLSRSVQ